MGKIFSGSIISLALALGMMSPVAAASPGSLAFSLRQCDDCWDEEILQYPRRGVHTAVKYSVGCKRWSAICGARTEDKERHLGVPCKNHKPARCHGGECRARLQSTIPHTTAGDWKTHYVVIAKRDWRGNLDTLLHHKRSFLVIPGRMAGLCRNFASHRKRLDFVDERWWLRKRFHLKLILI